MFYCVFLLLWWLGQTYFNTEIPSVHIVPQEKVASGGRAPPHLEQLHQVEELPVDVTTH